MKRCLRLCLVVLLSLTLPLAGMAGVRPPADPCPMRAAGLTAMPDMPDMPDMVPDCCDEAGAPAGHGQPCKPGQECKTASLLQVAIVKPPATLASPPAPAACRDSLPERTTPGVWRPPRG